MSLTRSQVTMPRDLYFDDLSEGDRFQTGSIEVTEQDILRFAREFDPQPMHADKTLAEQGPFKGLIASGWHTAALVIKLIAEAQPWGRTPMLGLGVKELKWPVPVRPGDRLHVTGKITATRVSESKPGYGIVTLDIRAVNQDGVEVYSAQPNCWVPRSPEKS